MIENLKTFCEKIIHIAERAQKLSPQRSLLDLPNRQNRVWDSLDGTRVACKDVAYAIKMFLLRLERGRIDRESFHRFIQSHLQSSYDDAVEHCYGSYIAAAKVRVYNNLFKRLDALNFGQREMRSF